jgi:FkbM family methyltransferase
MRNTLIWTAVRSLRAFWEISLAKFVFLVFRIVQIFPRGRQAASLALARIFSSSKSIEDSEYKYEFITPNWLTFFRAKSLFLKEPETIEWLKQIPEGSVLWDVGANVGTYSIYAGKRGCKVFAIEPSFLNIELLQRNIILNKLNTSVSLLPVGVGERTSLTNYFMSSPNLIWGGAHNSVDKNLGAGGMPLENPIEIMGFVFSMDDLALFNNVEPPQYLKIDVDGLELEVLKGGVSVLKGVRSILIEVDQDSPGQSHGLMELLKEANFALSSPVLDSSGAINQIWVRKS